jgi:crossover junction endodeoxyribonuclease RuvC
MLALGIDPGTALCGYGLVRGENEAFELVAYGAVSTPAKDPLPKRLHQIYKVLCEQISTHHPDAVSVEKLFFGRNTRSAISVGHVRGVALLAAEQAHLPVFEYTPAEVKQAIAGYGSADKHQMQQMVRMLLHLDFIPEPDDAADAVAIALCHLQSAHLRAMLQAQDLS